MLPPFERGKGYELRYLVGSICISYVYSHRDRIVPYLDKKEVTAQTRPLSGYLMLTIRD